MHKKTKQIRNKLITLLKNLPDQLNRVSEVKFGLHSEIISLLAFNASKENYRSYCEGIVTKLEYERITALEAKKSTGMCDLIITLTDDRNGYNNACFFEIESPEETNRMSHVRSQIEKYTPMLKGHENDVPCCIGFIFLYDSLGVFNRLSEKYWRIISSLVTISEEHPNYSEFSFFVIYQPLIKNRNDNWFFQEIRVYPS